MKAAKVITGWLIDNDAIKKEDEELYIYAVSNFVLTLIPVVSVLVFANLIGHLLEGLFMIIPFLVIRKFSGGFHFRSAVLCMVTSITVLILLLIFTVRIALLPVFDIGIVLSVISLSLNSPIDSEARRLDEEEISHFKRTAALIAVSFMIIYMILRAAFIISALQVLIGIAKSLSSGIILAALLQIPFMFKKRPLEC